MTVVARAEAKDASLWFRSRDPSTVRRFRERLKSAKEQLASFPESGERHLRNTWRLSLAPFPYWLIYEIEVMRVVIIAIPHVAQEEGHWASRD